MTDRSVRAAMSRASEFVMVLLAYIGGGMILVMMFHVTADVTIRYAFNTSLDGTLEIVSHYYMIAAVFLPLGLLETRRQSICVDLFLPMMPRSIQFASIIFGLLLMTATYAAMTYRSFDSLLQAWRISEVAMGFAQIPIWPSRLIFTIGLAGGFLASLLSLIDVFSSRELGNHQVDGV